MMRKLISVFVLIAAVYACSSGDDKQSGDNYDRTALLTNWADNIMIPAYENYQEKVQLLNDKTSAFTASPTTGGLQELRDSWLEAYKAYQYVAIYNIGKAEEVSLKESSNTYPANAAGIENNISSGNYNLTLFAQFDKQGFPGLDYLINGLGAGDDQIIAFYTSNPNAADYKQYLSAVANRLKTNADAVVADWNGGFRDSFIANNGTSVSSSVNKVVNNFVKNMERDIRSAKVGIPAGLMSNGTTFPDKVEGYYKSDVSKQLLNTAVQASLDFFSGKHFNDAAYGPGLTSFLDFLNAERDGQNLSTIIFNQYNAIFTASGAVDNNFSQQIFSDNSKMLALHSALQQNTVYLKLDMMQALNITIDYVDGDGD